MTDMRVIVQAQVLHLTGDLKLSPPVDDKVRGHFDIFMVMVMSMVILMVISMGMSMVMSIVVFMVISRVMSIVVSMVIFRVMPIVISMNI